LPEPSPANASADLISFLQAIPEGRMRRGVRFPQWFLLLVAVLGILSGCQSLRELERFAIRHHALRSSRRWGLISGDLPLIPDSGICSCRWM
jgi:hypothetical protein